MLTLKDLVYREYKDNEVVEFKYVKRNKKGEKLWEAQFQRYDNTESSWCMKVIMDRTYETDSQVYKIAYTMPRVDMPLTLIAATGLKYFQSVLKQEIDKKVAISFDIDEAVAGIVG